MKQSPKSPPKADLSQRLMRLGSTPLAEKVKSQKSKVKEWRNVSIVIGEISKSFSLRTVAEWSKVIAYLLPHLRPRVILALSGPLGAGKTTFVQALARALCVSREVQSPTFALLRSYRLSRPVNGITRLVHVDAYRIDDEQDLLPLDLDVELADDKTLLIIEWPERIPEWLSRHTSVISLTLSITASLRVPAIPRRGGLRPRS